MKGRELDREKEELEREGKVSERSKEKNCMFTLRLKCILDKLKCALVVVCVFVSVFMCVCL